MRQRAKRLVREAREQEPELSFNAAVQADRPAGGVEPGHVAGLVQAGRHRRRSAGRGPRRRRGEELKALRRENAELQRANEILLTASAFFARGARPPFPLIVDFIDEHK